MADTNRSFLGVGKVWVRPAGATTAFRQVGNVSNLVLGHELDIQRQRDYQRLGGGTAWRGERIQQVNINMTWLSFSPSNLAQAAAGSNTAVVGASITNEVVKCYEGTLMPLAHPPTAITSVTPSGGGSALAAGTDYQLSPGGIYWPEGTTATDGADYEVDYTHPAYNRIEGATSTSTVLQVMFEGLNEADSGKAVLVDLWQCSFPAASELAFLAENPGELSFSAELLKDASKGSGLSGFYRVRMV